MYFYKRLNPLSIPPLNAPKVRIPKRVGFDEEDEDVVCDSAFASAIKLAVGPVKGKAYCTFLFFLERILIFTCLLSLLLQHFVNHHSFLSVDLHTHAFATIESYLYSSRPVRERRPKVFYE